MNFLEASVRRGLVPACQDGRLRVRCFAWIGCQRVAPAPIAASSPASSTSSSAQRPTAATLRRYCCRLARHLGRIDCLFACSSETSPTAQLKRTSGRISGPSPRRRTWYCPSIATRAGPGGSPLSSSSSGAKPRKPFRNSTARSSTAARCRSARPGRARIVDPAGHDLLGLPVLDRVASVRGRCQGGSDRARWIQARPRLRRVVAISDRTPNRRAATRR